MSSDSDDAPLLGRFGITKHNLTKLEDVDEASNGSPIPEWISQATPIKSQPTFAISSDSEAEEALVKAERSPPGEANGAGPSQPGPTPGSEQKPPQAGKFKGGRAGRGIRLPLAGGPVKPGAPVGSDEAAALAGEIPIQFPAKMSTAKVIVELEGGKDGAATDLTGDAGVVGRFFRAGSGADEEMRLDLKGVVYSVSVLPAATTLCVVNIMQTEARVETVASSFLQLRECAGLGGEQDGAAPDDHFLFDDDDNYQVPAGGGGEEGPSQGKKKKRKGAEGGADAPPAKKRKSQGTTKPRAKAAKPKPRAKGGANAKGKK